MARVPHASSLASLARTDGKVRRFRGAAPRPPRALPFVRRLGAIPPRDEGADEDSWRRVRA